MSSDQLRQKSEERWPSRILEKRDVRVSALSTTMIYFYQQHGLNFEFLYPAMLTVFSQSIVEAIHNIDR